jgi:hypothetical protein
MRGEPARVPACPSTPIERAGEAVMSNALRLARRCRRLLLTCGVALGASMTLAIATDAAAAAGPALKLSSVSNTTVAPGTDLHYFVTLLNLGSTATDGSEIDVTVTLPPHVTAVGVSVFNAPITCTAGDGSSPVAGATVVRCATSMVIPLASGGAGALLLTVHVDDSASGVLTSTFDVTGGGAPDDETVDPTTVSASPPGFGIDAFDGQVTDAARGAYTQAGGHPYAITTSFDFNTETNAGLTAPPPYNPFSGDLWPIEPTKDVVVDLPPGFIGNPSVLTQCTVADLANIGGVSAAPLCAPSSQVGFAVVRLDLFGQRSQSLPVPVFNMVPPANAPARFGFNVSGLVVTLDARVRSDGDYGLSIAATNLPDGLAIAGNSITFWGTPADASHDAQRYCMPGIPSPCSAGVAPKPFLRNPTACTPDGTGLTTSLHVDSWFHPGAHLPDGAPDLSDPAWKSTSVESHLPPGYPAFPGPGQANWGPVQGPDHCEKVPFDPALDARPTGELRAGTPTPFRFDLTLPQPEDQSSPGEGDLRKAVVTLPQGVHVSPSSADGLGACTPAQIGLLGTNFPEPNRIRFNTNDPACPESSKIGTVTIDTPLLPNPLTGSVYLASPNHNPFGTLLAIYLVAQGSGITIKLPGKVETSASGQVTTTFDDAPQTPFSEMQLSFKDGPRAPLVLPAACGTYTTHAVLSSWSGKTVSSDSSFTVNHESDGSPCGGATFDPSFEAGTTNPVGGAETPFVLTLARSDRDRQLGALAVDMPAGLTGRIANTVLCPDAAASAGSCEDVSKVGSVTVGAGAGTNPFWITSGRAYITGPYKGAPFGLSIVVPAVAGPFDLGNVVVRSALFVDRHTTALKVVSDPFPTVLDGIPLDLRAVRVLVDRPHFIVNPTNCSARQVYGTITSADGVVAHRSAFFQRTDCAQLPFAPRMSLTVGGRGHTRSGGSTPLTTTLAQSPGQANLRVVSVTLPTTLNALLPVLNRACTPAQFAAGHCGGARAGSAVAVTPLLRDPLRGSAFFVRGPRLLPDLVIALRGLVDVDLVGKVGVNPRTNQLTTRFDTIPDVAIKRFTLRLLAGANDPLGTTTNLCSAKAKRAVASIGFRAQNGKVLNVRQRLRIRGCPRRR